MLIVLISLGNWQLKRYHYKQQLMQHYHQQINQPPLPFSQLNLNQDIRFQQVKVVGTYLNDYSLLLENRFYKNQIGFEVLTPFKIKNTQKVLLVNRGWVPMIADQQAAPLKPILEEQQITGYIQVLGYQGFTIGKNILTAQWPLLIQKIDFSALQQLTHLDFYPFVLRLNANQSSSFVSEWQPTTVPPQRHLAYAVQWFAMAIALIIAFLCFSRKKILRE